MIFPRTWKVVLMDDGDAAVLLLFAAGLLVYGVAAAVGPKPGITLAVLAAAAYTAGRASKKVAG